MQRSLTQESRLIVIDSLRALLAEIDGVTGRIPQDVVKLLQAVTYITDADVDWATKRHNEALKNYQSAKSRIDKLAAEFCACEPTSSMRDKPYLAMSQASKEWVTAKVNLEKAHRDLRLLSRTPRYAKRYAKE